MVAVVRQRVFTRAPWPDPSPTTCCTPRTAAEDRRRHRYARRGLLDVPDPRLAADRFVTLTFGVALDGLDSANAAEDTPVRPVVVEGVRTFLRAYRTL
ncbi:TetR/AcrR family transcriptional regulator C-terminal domain-containing protein [Streptomyces sp. NPDC127117]|uniref:TetR/AcrR family transcriptional regulator C-terminal domain-containing protein n=1 Tax=Streptomyces sp. NPDC127117 TaxID=3345368 RepID=UPI00363246FC